MLPLLPPNVAAYMATTAQHVFPILSIVGLASRLSALGLMVMTSVIQLFVYPDGGRAIFSGSRFCFWSLRVGPEPSRSIISCGAACSPHPYCRVSGSPRLRAGHDRSEFSNRLASDANRNIGADQRCKRFRSAEELARL
jgi:hypothetical protein